jgi:hypothetical protein
MDFIYTPEGADEKRWEWAPGRIPSTDAEIIERRTGMLFPEWSKACAEGSMLAQHAFIFVQLRKDNPSLEWAQVVFTADEVRFEFTEDDQRGWLENLEAAVGRGDKLNESEQAMLAALRQQFSDEAPGAGDEAAAGEATDPTEPPGEPGTTPESQPGNG